MQTKEQVLQNCTVEGMVVKLPSVQLDRKLYTDVAKSSPAEAIREKN